MRLSFFFRMTRHTVMGALLLSMSGFAQISSAQSAKKTVSLAKPSLDLLAARVDGYWKLLLERKKTQASAYVLPEHRDRFLDLTIAKFSDPRLKSLEPSEDRTEAKAVVTIKRVLPFGEMDWPVTATWVFKSNNWYLKLDTNSMPDEKTPPPPGKIKLEAEKYELQKRLRFEQSTLDFGMVPRGDSVSLALKYTLDGEEEIYAKINASNPAIKVQGLSNRRLLPGKSMELTVVIPTRIYEGIVYESIDLVARRSGAEAPFKFVVQGFVYVPVTFNPKILRLNPNSDAREKELLIRNNSRSMLEIQSISSPSGALELEPMPVTIPSGRQMALKLKQVREVEKANTAEKLILKFAQPVEDVAALEIPVVLNSADSRDGLIQDLLADPGIQKQIQENLKKSPKK
ncbi:MAG: hypothetical protein QUT30_17025 [Acidobacteriota bacterium]|nr:hypothetical protein [Acidobacteriota bacterium]